MQSAACGGRDTQSASRACSRAAHERFPSHQLSSALVLPAALYTGLCSSKWFMMEGAMQAWPLTVTHALEYSARWHPEQQIVCKTVEGPLVVSTYADLSRRSQLCALSLKALGIGQGDVVATLAWNTTRHLEVWYGVMGIGAICHTLNPRLSDADLTYIINHAGDAYIAVDASLAPILQRILKDCPGVKGVILLTDRQHMPGPAALQGLPAPLCYEQLLDDQVPGLPFQWPQLSEDAPCGLCYTSGTTGNPKGVLYTHRSNYLHAMAMTMPDALNLGSASTVLMVVPMFHANSWGLNFAGPMVGSKLVLPGPNLDGCSLYQLLDRFRVTFTAGVPTVWLGLLHYMQQRGIKSLPYLKAVAIAGSAPPRSMIAGLESLGCEVRHVWGMTELSPLGTVGVLKGGQLDSGLTQEEVLDVKVTQGRPHLFCDMRIVDDAGKALPHDGKAMGHLQVRGPIVLRQYHRHPLPTTEADMWFDTGDVATIDPLGYMCITDRSKDVVKSGGEWISSIQLENAAMGHPDVMEAAVIAIPDEKWSERPLLVVVPKPPAKGDEELKRGILEYMASHSTIAKFALPREVAFVQDIPHTATGKISKLSLRKQFQDYVPTTTTSSSRDSAGPRSRM